MKPQHALEDRLIQQIVSELEEDEHQLFDIPYFCRQLIRSVHQALYQQHRKHTVRQTEALLHVDRNTIYKYLHKQ